MIFYLKVMKRYKSIYTSIVCWEYIPEGIAPSGVMLTGNMVIIETWLHLLRLLYCFAFYGKQLQITFTSLYFSLFICISSNVIRS